MTKSWSKPYLPILNDHISLWSKADNKVVHKDVVKTVANKIATQIEKNEDEPILELNNVSFHSV